ncbi:MAG: SGNH/GDSL hydrolase family protein [Candidatus Woesearchaeota archaeon]
MKFIIFGGSTTIGKGDPENGGWAGRLRRHIESRDESHTVFILGIPGETTDGLKKRIKGEIKSRSITEGDLCLIAIGMNDSRMDDDGNNDVPKRRFKRNAKNIITKVRKFTKDIMVIGPGSVDEKRTRPFKGKHYTNKSIVEYSNILEDMCAHDDVRYIRTYQENYRCANLSDGLHPNPEEHERRYIKILEQMDKEFSFNI